MLSLLSFVGRDITPAGTPRLLPHTFVRIICLLSLTILESLLSAIWETGIKYLGSQPCHIIVLSPGGSNATHL